MTVFCKQHCLFSVTWTFPCFGSYCLSLRMAQIATGSIPLSAWRYLRVNPRYPITASELEVELGADLQPVAWLSKLQPALQAYAVPSKVAVHRCEAYRTGRVYAMD
eukprot:RCo013964